MPRLAILADDLTGALDTGVQFSKRGVKAAVVLYDQLPDQMSAHEAVLVVDTESRHLPAGEAGARVAAVILRARELGAEFFYKKTDSMLRGNVRSELLAALDASGAGRLHFIPAYPALGRTTEAGIHKLGGVPVHETAAAKDPLDPVRTSRVRELVGDDARIEIHDAKTDEDLRAIGALLRERGELLLTAGCAGFAPVLLGLLELAGETAAPDPGPTLSAAPLLVVGGSVNALSLSQLDFAARQGFSRLVPPPALKLGSGGDRGLLVGEAAARLRSGGDLILQSVRGREDGDACNRYAEENGISPEEIPRRIPHGLADLVRGILERSPEIGALVIFGGDTAIAAMTALRVSRIIPESEPLPGVVRSRIILPDRELTLVTKSGGFGGEDVLIEIRRLLRSES